MSALNLTPEEEALVLDALRTRANQYNAMFSSTDMALEALIAKVVGQLPQPEPVVVVEPEPAATEVVEPEATVEATQEAPDAE
jgi:hypothetical protein